MTTEDDGFISSSRLAKDLGWPVGSVFSQLRDMGLAEKVGEKWELTQAGKARGGKYLSSKKYGTWIAWPKNVIKVESSSSGGEAKLLAEVVKEQHLTATSLGRTFGIPATRMIVRTGVDSKSDKGLEGDTARGGSRWRAA